jgi:hypothetical protein
VNRLTIVPRYRPDPPQSWLRAAENTFQRLQRERPELLDDEGLADLQATQPDDAPMLHLDDQSGTALFDCDREIHYKQDLARVRASAGDLVATSLAPVAGYETYCREYLGLGDVRWLSPRTNGKPTELAAALWQDELTRDALVKAAGESLHIDPYQGNASVWQLAALLDEQCPGQVRIVAPLPAITAWANHKVEFTEIVCELFGEALIPRTRSAANLALAAEAIRDLAPEMARIVIKLPDSAGGGGNVLLDCGRFRDRPLNEIHKALQDEFAHLDWHGESELLIGEWEPEVVKAPSAQLWIPPGEEPPVVEGLFEQVFGEQPGMFLGARAAELGPELEREIVDRSWVLARLFQRLGYVGRCSFDLLLLDGHGGGRLKFLECNGRWGGASMPMSLMNRLFGDWTRQPFVIRNYDELGLERTSFVHLLQELREELFDIRTGHGRLILTNPARMEFRGGIGALILSETPAAAEEWASHDVPKRLQAIGR